MTAQRQCRASGRRLASLIILGMVLSTMPATATELPAPAEGDSVAASRAGDRPTIGLVLGGGGARGPAHIGVLRVLDELQVPIDYVGGTSMGAIVAALFALGMTPDEIEGQICSIDWDDLFTDTLDRYRRTYRRKEDDNAFFLPFEFGLSNGTPVTNRGVIAGQKLGFAFPNPQIYTAGYRGFDNLAYPLRMIATDLHTGEMVVMDRGNLVQSVRASMSIPGLFPPVPWEGRELIDGGVVRNLPVDVVRAMGADIIIAIDVGTLPEDTSEEKLGSFAGILAQTLTIQGRLNVIRQIGDADVFIQVDLEDISFKDFKRVAETIPLGEASARAQADALAQFSIPENAYRAHLEAHRLPPRQNPVIDLIVSENSTTADDRAIRRRIHQQVGHPLDLALLKDDLADIYDLGVAELVDFAVIETDSLTRLTVSSHPKLYSPHIMRVGFSYVGGQDDKSHAAMRLRHTWLEMNSFGGEWRNDLQFGRVFGIKSEFYQPVTWSRVPFLAASGWFRKGNYDWYEDLVDHGDYNVTDYTGTFDLGSRLSHRGALRVGVLYGHVTSTTPAGLGPDEFAGHVGGFTSRLTWDTMDHPLFPTGGVAGEIDFFSARTALGSDLEYDKLEGRATGAASAGASTLRLTVRGGTNMATELPDYETFAVGGLDRLSGYHDHQLRGQTYGIGSVRWYHKVFGSPSLFPTTWYVGCGVEAGNAWPDRHHARLDDLRYCFNVSIMANTYIGPMVAAYGRAEDGNDAVYLILGSRTSVFE